MSTRSALGTNRLISKKLFWQRPGYYRNLVAKQANQRRTRSMLIETLEDRRVMTVNLGEDLVILSGSIVDSTSASAQLLESIKDIPEIHGWQSQVQATDTENQADALVLKQQAEQQMEERLESTLSPSHLAQWTIDSSQPVSQGTRTIAGAISQSIAATNWQDQWQNISTESASQLASSLEQGQQPSNPLQVTSSAFDSLSISQAMSQAASSSQLIGGQLAAASASSDLPASLRQAESQIMAAATEQQWSGDGTSQVETNSVDLGLDAQSAPLNSQQLSQAIDGSLFAGLFGSQMIQTAQDPGGVGSQSAMMAEGEGGSSGSGGSTGNNQAAIPNVTFPQLRFAQGGVSPDNFIPTGLSNFTDTRGSMGPFAGGSNWVHTVTVNWIDEQNWTYTETLTMRFFVGDATVDGGPLEPSTDEDTDDESDARLQTQGTWTSVAGSLRGGYVQLTFNALRGNTSGVNSPWFNIFGSGTRWNVSMSFSDTVYWYGSASSSSTGHVNPAPNGSGNGEGEGSQSSTGGSNQQPDDFTASANWEGTFYSMQSVSGTLSISSTPFWITQGSTPQTSVVDRLIISNGSTTLEHEFSEHEEFTSSSQSGNLTAAAGTTPEDDPAGPNNPLPRGGRKDIDFGDELDKQKGFFDAMNSQNGQTSSSTGGQGGSGQGTGGGTENPGTNLVGHGAAASVSYSQSTSGNASNTGDWNFIGAFREQYHNSRWVAGLGGASSQAQATLDAQGRSDGRIIVIHQPEAVQNSLIGGTTTYSGKMIAGYNTKVSGDGSASGSLSAVLNVDYSTGELVVEPDDDIQAEIQSNVNGSGKQFLTVDARQDDSGQVNLYAVGGELITWAPTVAYKTLRLHSESVGTTLGNAFSRIVDGGPPLNGATLKSEGSGHELYETTYDQDLDVYHSGTLSHTLDQIANGNTTLEHRDYEKMDLTVQLQNSQPVLNGTAYREMKGNLEYKDHFDAKYALGAYNKRDAELTKTATYRSDFDPVANQIVRTASNNGAQVGITGSSAIWVGGLFGLGDGQLEVTPHTTLSNYEAGLQAIFSDWDIDEVIDLDLLQANAGSPGSNLQTNGDSPEGEEPPRQTSVSDLMLEFNSHTHAYTPDAIDAAHAVQSFLGEASPIGAGIGIYEAGKGKDFETETKLSLWQQGFAALGAALTVIGIKTPFKGQVDDVAVKGIKSAGVFNHTAKSLDDARAIIQKAMPDAVELPPAVAGQPYPKPPKGVHKWFQLHPPEPGARNYLPHFKYADWTNGKKGTGGSWGHIFFPE